VFPDRGGDLITLRPELTPSLARMVAQKQNELTYPLRWWSFGPFWRYERPQKGRSREFFQWNIDMIGVESAEADAELVGICVKFLKSVNVTPDQVKVLVNHRELIDVELGKLGVVSDLKKAVFKLIDRKDKLPFDKWQATALEAGLTQNQLEGVVTLLENKELWRESEYLSKVFSILEKMGVADYVEYDPKIIRGLDYYTGLVFEAWDVGGDGRSVLGGGHYSNLIGDVGGSPLGGVGFAMGDMMMNVILEKYGLLPQFETFEKTVLVTVFDEALMLSSVGFASELRSNGVKTICYPEISKLQKQFKYADRMGIELAVVIGPDEDAQGLITIKDLKSGSQETIKREDAAAKIQQML
ncbi:MAG: ATP phosphoribosyltransferase regulatory subunit, partial [Anaerolineaceae bacterium]|nr:ATP phosphoribosyltransferase regulatory subunit [Anaerolineaceae bacterium]